MSPTAPPGRSLGRVMIYAMWLVVIGLLTLFFDEILERLYNPNRTIASTVGAGGVIQVELKRNRQGQYITSGRINGQPVVFLVDTGASDVAVPSAVARRLNLKRGPRAIYQTANGPAAGFRTRLQTVAVGGIELTDIAGSIAPGWKSDEVLLGMSFLKNLELVQRGDVLTLRHPP